MVVRMADVGSPWMLHATDLVQTGNFSHMAEDLTVSLIHSHWPSYNVPYFRDVYEVSGYAEMAGRHGVDLTYQLAPRAKIFRRDAQSVRDISSMRTFMRENNFGHGDPLADTAWSAIAGALHLRWYRKPQTIPMLLPTLAQSHGR